MAKRSRLLMWLAGPLAAAGGCHHFLRAPASVAEAGPAEVRALDPAAAAELRAADTQFAELQHQNKKAVDSIWVSRREQAVEALVPATWGEPDVSPIDGAPQDGPSFPEDQPAPVPSAPGATEPAPALPDPAAAAHGTVWATAEKLPPPTFGPVTPAAHQQQTAEPPPARPAEAKAPVRAAESLPAPNARPAPSVQGERIALRPNETPIERALALTRELEQSQAEARGLRDRVQALEGELHVYGVDRDQYQRDAERLAAENARYRARMEALNEEVVSLRERVARSEQRELQSLQEIVSVLERLALDPPPRKPGH